MERFIIVEVVPQAELPKTFLPVSTPTQLLLLQLVSLYLRVQFPLVRKHVLSRMDSVLTFR